MTEGPDGNGGPHVYVTSLETLEIGEEDRSHLDRSLRLRSGDALTVSDGAGSWRACRFGPSLEPDGPIQFVDAPTPSLTVGFALTKGAKPELIVQKLTELGVDRIAPFRAERSIPRWSDDKAAGRHARLERVARQAAMQSRRVWSPVIVALGSYSDFPDAVRAGRGGEALTEAHGTVLIGPEGGWSSAERAALSPVDLGPHVLRAETAAIAAGALMAQLRAASQR